MASGEVVEITKEKREQMNRLYFSAIAFRRAHLDFIHKVNQLTVLELNNCGARLHGILCEIAGHDPVPYETPEHNVLETARILAGG